MADWKTCFNFMMDSEDPRREYADVEDAGGRAISGINSHAFPGEYAAIAAFPQSERALPVEMFYKSHFWNQWFEQIVSDDLACRVFDAAVNIGAPPAVRLLQEAVNTTSATWGGPEVTVDGKWGPETVKAINSYGAPFVIEFKDYRVSHYQAIAAANPALAKYLPQWIVRAER